MLKNFLLTSASAIALIGYSGADAVAQSAMNGYTIELEG